MRAIRTIRPAVFTVVFFALWFVAVLISERVFDPAAEAQAGVSLLRVGSGAVDTGNGTAGSGTLRVAIASNNTAFGVNLASALPAGTNNIGDVDIATIAAGDNNIGNVDVLSLPALPAGTNNIGDVDVLSLPALPAGTNNIGDIDVLSLPALPAGTNNIGDIDVLSIAAGDNNIGNVDIVSMPNVTISGTVTTDQTNAAEADYDSGAGTVNNVMFGLALPGSGGPVAGGTSANPLNVVFPSAQAVTQSGTWTVQPGNTANTTPWLTTIAQGGNSAVVTAGGRLQVTCDNCGGSGGTSMVDDAAFTPGTTSITPIGFVFDDVSPDTVNEGDGGAPRMSANRVAYFQIRDAAGNERGANVDANNALLVNNVARLEPQFDGVYVGADAAAVGSDSFRDAALTNTDVAVKASAGRVYGYHVYNPNSSDIFIQFYDAGTGAVTVGTTTPKLSLVIPGGGVLDAMSLPVPISFGTAITVAATTTAGGGTAPTTALVANVVYK
jgi:hypothetical protein